MVSVEVVKAMVTSTFTGGHTIELVNPVKHDNIDRSYIDSSGLRQIFAPKLSHAYVQYDTAAAPASSSFSEDLYIHTSAPPQLRQAVPVSRTTPTATFLLEHRSQTQGNPSK